MSARPDPAQLSLLDALAGAAAEQVNGTAPAGDVDGRLRAAVAAAIKESPRTREQIAERMTAELGVTVTVAQLNAWTAESKGGTHRFPASYLPAFCAAAGSLGPLALLVEVSGGWCATRGDRLRVERWAVEERKRALRRQERMLDAALEAMR